MTSKELSSLYWLERDIADSEERLEVMRVRAEPGASKASGIPSGGSDVRAGEDIKIAIAEQSKQIERMKAMAERKRAAILRFACSVDDPQMRLIIKYRFADCLPWHMVAWKLGGGNTGDGCRMRFKRFIAGQKEQS